MFARLSAAVIVCALLSWPATAQDVAPAPVGNSAIAGQVTDDLGRALARAIVHAIGPVDRSAITDDDGRFRWTALPPGSYRVQAMKALYSGAWFGQPAGAVEGTVLELAPNARRDIVVTLRRTAVITGRIVMADGTPASGANVSAIPSTVLLQGAEGLERRADRNGNYRLFGLPPGEDLVSASLPGSYPELVIESSQPGGTATFSLPPRFYPSAVRVGDAQMISLGAGQERQGIDVRLALVENAAVRAIVTTASEGSRDRIEMALVPADGGGLSPRDVNWVTFVGAEHTFVVVAGRYTAMLMTQPRVARGETPRPRQWASADVTTDGRTPIDVLLTPQPALSLSGTVVSAGGDLPKQFQIEVPPVTTSLAASAASSRWHPYAGVDGQGKFAVTSLVPGVYTLRALLPEGWTAVSAMLDGVDILHVPFELTDHNLSGVLVTVTKSVTEIRGTARDTAGLAAFSKPVIAFADDHARRWREEDAGREIAALRYSLVSRLRRLDG